MVSTAIFPNITEKLENMTYFDILFSQFWGCYCRPRCYMPPTAKKRCCKITTGHK